MFKIRFDDLFQISQKSPNHALKEDEINSWLDKFDQYKAKIESRKQAFLDLPNDQETLEAIQDFTTKTKKKYDFIVVMGMGGSILGPQTIIDSLYRTQSAVKVIFADNIDPWLISEIETTVNLSKTLFLVQTKSGTTPETLAQYFYFRAKLIKKNLPVSEHFVFVTDPGESYLQKVSRADKITHFYIPPKAGGRFSVLSSVGLLITSLVGLNPKTLLQGAEQIKKEYFDGQNTDAFKVAISQFLLNQKGKNINVLMPYSSRLKTFASWYIQLLSESLGKIKTDGQNAGITPLPALGSTDQHSQLQLFKEGPNDKFVIFLEIDDFGVELDIPNIFAGEKGFEYLEGQTFNSLISAEFRGTRQSLTESERPNITITVEQVDELSLGGLFMFFEITTAFVGELLEINAFDQPGVERSKVITRELLTNP